MSLALIETLCVSRYQVDIRTVRNPPRTFSIFPDNILEVAARLFRDGELKPPADLN
jgi:hypothetical protein